MAIYEVSLRSILEDFLDDLLVHSKVVLVIDVPCHGQVKHGVTSIVLLVDICSKAKQGLDVVLLDVHDSVVKGRSTKTVGGVGVEGWEGVFEEEDGYNSSEGEGCAVERGQTFVRSEVEVGLVLEKEDPQNIKVADHTGKMDSCDSALCAVA